MREIKLSVIIRIVKWWWSHTLACQGKASLACRRGSQQITAHSYSTCNTAGESKVSTHEHRHSSLLPTASVSTVHGKVNLEPELLMVESKVQTAGYRFISCVLTLSCISACTDEIHAGREAGGDKNEEKRRAPRRVLNVWKSVLPILAIKSEQQQAHTHNSEWGGIGDRSQLNQRLTFNMAAEWRKNTYEKETESLLAKGWFS